MHEYIQHFFHGLFLFFSRNDWATDSALILFGMIVFHWISRVTYRFLIARFDTGRHVWLISFIRSVHAPWLTFFWVLVFSFIIPIVMLHFHIDLSKLRVINTIRSFAFVIAFYWSLWNFITNMEEEIAPSWKRMPIRDKTTIRAVAQLSRVALTILLILSVLPLMGFETSSLLAFGGVGGIAVGFAAKDTLANFLGGMMIFWDRPFSVGDWIRSPDRNIEGTVEHIGWRLTRIRTSDKRPLYVPNGVFSTITIENPSRMSHRQINLTIGLRYDDAEKIAPVAKAIETMLRQHPNVDQAQNVLVNFMEFAASSLNINVYCFTKITETPKFRVFQQDIFLKIIAIIGDHGAECAFPTTTVLMPNYDTNKPT